MTNLYPNPYIVSYESETYNQHRSYFRNQNRYARNESFDTLEQALAFAEEIKSTARRSHPIKVRDYYRCKTIAQFEWDQAKSEWVPSQVLSNATLDDQIKAAARRTGSSLSEPKDREVDRSI